MCVCVCVCVLNNSPYGKKKPGNWFEDENIQRIGINGKKYIYKI